MRSAFLSDPKDLIPTAIQLATDTDPWADKIQCSVEDYVAAGLQGDRCRIPVPKSASARASDFSRFTHPLSRERMEEDARSFRLNTHIFEIEPTREVARGTIQAPETRSNKVYPNGPQAGAFPGVSGWMPGAESAPFGADRSHAGFAAPPPKPVLLAMFDEASWRVKAAWRALVRGWETIR